MRLEDIRAEAQCYARSIPSPADFGWQPPSGPRPEELGKDELTREELIKKIKVDPTTIGALDISVIQDRPFG